MTKKLIAITIVALSFVLVNCKDKTTDDPEPAKTLNKSLITGKYWKAKTAPLDHYFGVNGKYLLPDGITEFGTWRWLNNSDSMEIVIPQLSSTQIWHAEYCTETELKMRAGSNKIGTIYYKQ